MNDNSVSSSMRFVILVLPILSLSCRLGFDAVAETNADANAQADASPSADAVREGALACPMSDPDTVALYTFDSDDGIEVTDVARGHDGRLVNGSFLSYIDGPDGCGSALSFDEAGGPVYAEIPNSGAWELASGSVDLWVMPMPEVTLNDFAGIVSRDAMGANESGHFSLRQWNEAGTEVFMVRMQGLVFGEGGFLCSDGPVEHGRRWQWRTCRSSHRGWRYRPSAHQRDPTRFLRHALAASRLRRRFRQGVYQQGLRAVSKVSLAGYFRTRLVGRPELALSAFSNGV